MAKQMATKAKKRDWLPISAPSFFGSKVVGETLVGEAEQAVGRPVVTNLMTLMGDPKKQHVNVRLEIDGVKENRATSRVTGYEVIPASIKRNVRRYRDRIDVSFLVTSKDGKTMRVKALLITNGNSPNSTQSAVRLHAIGWLTKYASDRTFDEFMQDVIMTKIQRILRANMRALYPMRSSDIRVLQLISEDPKDAVKPSVVVEKELVLDLQPKRKKIEK